MENSELNQQVISPSQNIIDRAKAAESEGSSFMNPQPAKKAGKRGRPAGSTKKAEPGIRLDTAEKSQADTPKKPIIETKALCYPIVKIMSNTGVAVLKDKRAAMSADEAESVAEGMGLLFDKYLPDIMQNYGAEAAFFVGLGQWGMKLYSVSQLQKIEFLEAELKRKNNQTVSNSPVNTMSDDSYAGINLPDSAL